MQVDVLAVQVDTSTIRRDMPAGVLGFEAVDEVEREDYEKVLVPAINETIAEHPKDRIVYVLGPEFD